MSTQKFIASFSAEKDDENFDPNINVFVIDQGREGTISSDSEEEEFGASGSKPQNLPSAKFLPDSLPHKALKASLGFEDIEAFEEGAVHPRLPSSILSPKLMHSDKPNRRPKIYSCNEFPKDRFGEDHIQNRNTQSTHLLSTIKISDTGKAMRRGEKASNLYRRIKAKCEKGQRVAPLIERVKQVLIKGITAEDRVEYWLLASDTRRKTQASPNIVQKL